MENSRHGEPLHLSEVAGDIIAYDVNGNGVFVMVGINHKDEVKAKSIIERVNACAGMSDEEVERFANGTMDCKDCINATTALKAELAEAREKLATMTALTKLKYGNLDALVWPEIQACEAFLNRTEDKQ